MIDLGSGTAGMLTRGRQRRRRTPAGADSVPARQGRDTERAGRKGGLHMVAAGMTDRARAAA